jgi:hypothetical protein
MWAPDQGVEVGVGCSSVGLELAVSGGVTSVVGVGSIAVGSGVGVNAPGEYVSNGDADTSGEGENDGLITTVALSGPAVSRASPKPAPPPSTAHRSAITATRRTLFCRFEGGGLRCGGTADVDWGSSSDFISFTARVPRCQG